MPVVSTEDMHCAIYWSCSWSTGRSICLFVCLFLRHKITMLVSDLCVLWATLCAWFLFLITVGNFVLFIVYLNFIDLSKIHHSLTKFKTSNTFFIHWRHGGLGSFRNIILNPTLRLFNQSSPTRILTYICS